MISTPDTDILQAYGATGLLAGFNRAGVLDAPDVRVAETIGRIARRRDDQVLLALALTVRALRRGSVCVDLRTVSTVAFDESDAGIDLATLPWPEPDQWLSAVAASDLVADGAALPSGRPLRLAGGQLYLERYWRQEEQVRHELRTRLDAPTLEVDLERTAAGLNRLFPPGSSGDDRQRLATAVSALSRVTVIAGGPGTGKTTTVARVLALLHDQPGPSPRIALAAPTGKAAARLIEAVRDATSTLPLDDSARIGSVTATTLHRLLGWLPQSRGRFHHDANNQLPHDAVIVDEMSMVSLTMMARLLEAIRPSARLILVGDPDQLSSVEAGAVLADIARAPGTPDHRLTQALSELGMERDATREPVHGVVQLTHTWRYGGRIEALARAIRDADADAVMEVLHSGEDDVGFVEIDLESHLSLETTRLATLGEQVRESGRATVVAAREGDASAALTALDRHRLLCGHRRGPYGVQRWSLEVEHWLSEALPGYGDDGEWYLGRPLLVTANDYDMGLFNGDTGVIIDHGGSPRAAFTRGTEPVLYSPVRLDAIQTVHAMTVHRAQGSQFESVSFVVPPVDSPLLTRELLYTAVTRATRHVRVIGTEAALRRAVARPANRASGLRNRLARPSG